jgi:outer membrane protein OmpA-like peptidoglycan-associated protein
VSDKKKRRRMAFAGLGAGAGVIGALLALGLIGLSGMRAGTSSQTAWVRAVMADLKGKNFGWLDIEVADRIATVGGDAPDIDSQRYGFEAAETALKADPQGGDSLLVVDATTLQGGAASVGAALKKLSPAPATGECQAAFAETMSGRFIQFESGPAAISTESARLLNALTAVALRCKAHTIEIGGHTDLTGAPRRNQALSQVRAEAVRDYLAANGVSKDGLRAVGYGMERPLINARNLDADAANRRIEFKVE